MPLGEGVGVVLSPSNGADSECTGNILWLVLRQQEQRRIRQDALDPCKRNHAS